MLLAHLYPDDVKALILFTPGTMDADRLAGLLQRHYYDYATLAEEEGMEAVANRSFGFFYWSELCEHNPENRDRLLSIPAERFAALMRKWAAWGPLWCAGLGDVELSGIDIPAITAPGHDPPDGLHPWQPAVEVQKRLPNCEFVNWRQLVGPERWKQVQDKEITGLEAIAPVYDAWEKFIERVEAT